MSVRKQLLALLFVGMAIPASWGQTELPQGHEITLLPGYMHKPLRRIDSEVGSIVKKNGLTITYTMGPIAKPGERVFSGIFVNAGESASMGVTETAIR